LIVGARASDNKRCASRRKTIRVASEANATTAQHIAAGQAKTCSINRIRRAAQIDINRALLCCVAPPI